MAWRRADAGSARPDGHRETGRPANRTKGRPRGPRTPISGARSRARCARGKLAGRAARARQIAPGARRARWRRSAGARARERRRARHRSRVAAAQRGSGGRSPSWCIRHAIGSPVSPLTLCDDVAFAGIVVRDTTASRVPAAAPGWRTLDPRRTEGDGARGCHGARTGGGASYRRAGRHRRIGTAQTRREHRQRIPTTIPASRAASAPASGLGVPGNCSSRLAVNRLDRGGAAARS